MKKPRYSDALVLALSLLAGVALMICQIVWLRMLGLFFGLHIFSVVSTLASLMGGMALGSLIAGRFADQKSPLIVFSLFMALTAVFALTSPWFHTVLKTINSDWLRHFQPGSAGLVIARFFLSLLILLIPSFSTGAVIPLLSRIYLRAHRIGSGIALVSAASSVGSLAGAFITGFFLIPTIGLQNSLYLSSIIAFVCFAAALIGFFVRIDQSVLSGNSPVHLAFTPVPEIPRWIIWLILFVSGFTIVGTEVLWNRVMIEFSYDKSTYVYVVVSMAYIAGMLLGNILVRQRSDGANPGRLLGILLILWGLVSFLQLDVASYLFPRMMQHRSLVASWLHVAGKEYLMMFLLLIFPAVFSGMVWPLAAGICVRTSGKPGTSVGFAACIEMAGSMAGAFLPLLFFLPRIGSVNTLIWLGILPVFCGILLLLRKPILAPKRRLLLFMFSLALFLPVLYFLPRDVRFKSRIGKRPGEQLLYYKEGIAGTVSVHAYPLGFMAMSINGSLYAYTTGEDLRSHRMLSYLPFVYRPDANKIMVVGLGMGVTAASFLQKGADRIDIAEISDEVARVCRTLFSGLNREVLSDKRCRLIREDGRTWLSAMPGQYDIITCDATHPRYGNNLYTSEFFAACRNALSQNGVMCQWMPVNWISEKEYQGVLHSFLSAFPYVHLWYVNRGVTLAVGSGLPLNLRGNSIADLFADDRTRNDLEETDIRSPEEFLARYLCKEETLLQYAGTVQQNTDNLPWVEFGRRISMAPNSQILRYFVKCIERNKRNIPLTDSSKFISEKEWRYTIENLIDELKSEINLHLQEKTKDVDN